jgi:hypothetical protein
MLLSAKVHQTADNSKTRKSNEKKALNYSKNNKDKERGQVEAEDFALRNISNNALLTLFNGNTDAIKKDPQSILSLQRTIGNRNVQRLLFPELKQSEKTSKRKEIEENEIKNKPSTNTGKPLDSNIRREMEPTFEHDFSNVMIYTDPYASKTAKSLQADAFTIGKEIYFAETKYKPSTTEGKQLLAHELTHVVQQNSNSRTTITPHVPQLKPEAASAVSVSERESGLENEANRMEKKVLSKEQRGKEKTELKVAPGIADLQGKKNFKEVANFEDIDEFITQHEIKKGSPIKVNAKFGSLAEGPITVKKTGKTGKEEYNGEGNLSILHHPLLPASFGGGGGGGDGRGAGLQMAITINKDNVNGYISFGGKQEFPGFIKKKDPEILRLFGLQSFDLEKIPVVNNIDDGGNLVFGIKGFSFSIGNIFSGKGTVIAENDNVKYEATGDVNVKGLEKGSFELKRDEKNGLVSGKAELAVILKEGKFSGNLVIIYTDGSVTGEGKVDYKSDKFSGQVILRLADENEAAEINESKKMLPKSQPGKIIKPNYAVAGEGTLNFAFNEWLTGTANVVVDSKGDITVIGQIAPPKEVELFEEKSYRKDLAKKEARASYGLPVVGNIFLFAGVELFLWGKIGPGKLYGFEIDGTYSTKPEVRKGFEGKARLNISAAAGITLRGEGGAGIEILYHDIKAGVGVNGTLGVKGYVDAGASIGYREEGEADEDKKGVYFITGDMEIAAMPFLALSGDLFIELDSPTLSPAPDKTWRWELGDKEWPLGGSFGIKASVDHVLGSKVPPSIEFQEVDFSAEKFMTDLIEEKTAPSGQAAAQKAGEWKEKNIKDAEAPSATALPQKPPGVEEGTIPVPVPAKSPPIGPKKTKKEEIPPSPQLPSAALPTVKGESPEEQKANQKKIEETKKKVEKELKEKGPQKGPEKAEQEKIDEEKSKEREKEKEERWQNGIKVIDQALAYKEKTGIRFDELNTILNSIRRQKKFGFTELYAKEEQITYGIYASMSPATKIAKIPKVRTETIEVTNPKTGKREKHTVQITEIEAKQEEKEQIMFEDLKEKQLLEKEEELGIEVEEYTRQRLGMKDYPLHHVFPQECRCWFETRNFDIDNHTVKLDPSRHEAIHPKYRLSREQRKELKDLEMKKLKKESLSELEEKEVGKFPAEWNDAIMLELLEEEEKKGKGRKLDPDEILKIGKRVMRRFRIIRVFRKYPGEKTRGSCSQLKLYKESKK